MGSVFFVALRRLRAPLILIILIFTVAIIGLVLIPGVDEQGRPWRMSVFQAFYFVTYTATTIGFGEVPHAFTDTQRLWVTLIIYLSVIGWAFLLGALLGLTQDKGFQQAIVTARFARAVKGLREPFYLICGLGETGLMVVQSLDQRGVRFVVVDTDATRLLELDLQEHATDALFINADGRSPETLIMAGLKKRECRGVLALTNDDEVNLAIAISVRLLNPGLPAICRSHSPAVSASMATVGTYQTINPFVEFGEHLLLAMRAPDSHRLITWIVGPPGSYLAPRIPPPPGRWIVCGYGRFGSQVVAAIRRGGFAVTIIDPAAREDAPVAEQLVVEDGVRLVQGRGTDLATLNAAGIGACTGLVAGTDNDTSNLAIAIAARRLCPGLFVIARQNQIANRALFDALGAEITMVSSQIVANECVAILRTPLMAEMLEIVRAKDDDWALDLVSRLRELLGEARPEFWSLLVCGDEAPGLIDVMGSTRLPVRIADLRRSTADRKRSTASLALLMRRDGRIVDLPGEETEVRVGDQLLFAGGETAQREQRDIVMNANVAAHVIAGRGSLGGTVWGLLAAPEEKAEAPGSRGQR